MTTPWPSRYSSCSTIKHFFINPTKCTCTYNFMDQCQHSNDLFVPAESHNYLMEIQVWSQNSSSEGMEFVLCWRGEGSLWRWSFLITPNRILAGSKLPTSRQRFSGGQEKSVQRYCCQDYQGTQCSSCASCRIVCCSHLLFLLVIFPEGWDYRRMLLWHANWLLPKFWNSFFFNLLDNSTLNTVNLNNIGWIQMVNAILE